MCVKYVCIIYEGVEIYFKVYTWAVWCALFNEWDKKSPRTTQPEWFVVLTLYSRCLQSAENADPQFHLEYRGPVTMKGKKEPMKVWFLSRKPTDTESTMVKT